MKVNKRISSLLSALLTFVLIAAMALSVTGCGDKENTSSPVETSKVEVTTKELGEGKTQFDFSVVNAEGKETKFIINTDKKTVGEALIELGLIKGDEGAYGLYVKTVNGETLDYDKDGKYWAFYVDGQYASKGVELTEIEAGISYSFKAEKS